jgi:hypothetical protein
MKLLMHVVMLCLLITTISLLSLQFTPYMRSCQETFSRVFVPTTSHYTVTESVSAMRSAAVQYFEFPTRSINRWQFVAATPDGATNYTSVPSPAMLTMTRNLVVSYDAQAHQFNFSTPVIVTEHYAVQNKSVFAPFDGMTPAQLEEFVFTLETVELVFSYFNVAEGPLGTMPVMWNVTCSFDFTGDGGVMQSDIDLRETVLGPADLPAGTSLHTLDIFLWLNCLSAFVALVSLVLNVLELRRGYRLYQRVKVEFPKGVMLAGSTSSGQRIYTSWSNVPFDVKIQFFNVWSVVVILGSAFVIVANAFGVMTSFGYGGVDNDMYHAFLGSGAFFYSLAFIRYLEFSHNLLALTLTVKMAMSRVMYMFISIMPIFCGYLMLGVILFSRYSLHFSNLNETAVSLFSLINGDNIHDTFDDLNRDFPYKWLPRIYVFTFVAFFITVVLNTLIFIVEDAFQNAKRWVWNDPAQIGQRRPFDICELFDIIDARQAQSRRNLANYFRQRAQGSAGPAAQARALATTTSTQLQLPQLNTSSEDVPYSFVSSNLPSLRASANMGAGDAAAAGSPEDAPSTSALEGRLARMELQQQQLFDTILALKSQLAPRTGSIN